jgi:hypothetical protein
MYEKIHLKGFNNFVKRMTNEIIVSFYNNEVLCEIPDNHIFRGLYISVY